MVKLNNQRAAFWSTTQGIHTGWPCQFMGPNIFGLHAAYNLGRSLLADSIASVQVPVISTRSINTIDLFYYGDVAPCRSFLATETPQRMATRSKNLNFDVCFAHIFQTKRLNNEASWSCMSVHYSTESKRSLRLRICTS